MEAELARNRFDYGAHLVFLQAPNEMEFGIDLYQWTIGPRFIGLKMIPPGLHVISYSASASSGTAEQRQSIFKHFESRHIYVYKWDPSTEEAVDITDTQEACAYQESTSYLTGIGLMDFNMIGIKELDSQLGAYPLQSKEDEWKLACWQSLVNYISPAALQKCLSVGGRLSSMTASNLPDSMDNRLLERMKQSLAPASDHLLTESELKFTSVPIRKSYPPGSTGEMLTKHSRDKSWLLQNLLFGPAYQADFRSLLGELQLAFLCLLVAHNFEGLEQWKLLVQLLCHSSDSIKTSLSFKRKSDQEMPSVENNESTPESQEHTRIILRDLFVEFIRVLKCQLEQIPRDFFEDFISRDNFLRECLVSFYTFAFFNDDDERLDYDPSMAATFKGETICDDLIGNELRQLSSYLKRAFKWDLHSEALAAQQELDREEQEEIMTLLENSGEFN